jgi:hypothetical protein
VKLRYDKENEFRIIFPVDLQVSRGTTFETTDKDTQKRLKDLGFHEVKQNKKKEDDE